jgi:uncharacterized hydrophobic protein (TIGR00271 family)
VEARTSENTELNANFLAFMVLACLLACVAIILDSPILIIGAMVVGPEFGPIAGLCVAVVQRRKDVFRRSLIALAVGFPLGITAAFLFTLIAKEAGLIEAAFSASEHPNTDFISHPDWFSFIVAYLAGTAGVLSLTSSKSGALIGVRERRACRCLRRRGRVDGRHGAARSEPRGDLPGRHRDALHPAPPVPAAPPRASEPRGA